MVYGDDDYYHIDNKKAAEMACQHTLIVSHKRSGGGLLCRFCMYELEVRIGK